MGKEYIPLFLDFNETTQDLTDEECGRLVRAMVDYANDSDYESRLTGAEKIAFRFMKGLIDRNSAISEARAKAGSKRNKPEQQETSESKPEQNETKPEIKEETKKETETKAKEKEVNKERFERFWKAYPRHENRKKAEDAFNALKVDDSLLERMIASIEKQKSGKQWLEDGGQYIPHPTTWLHGKRWEDEVQAGNVRKMPTNPAQNYTQRSYDEPSETLEELMKRVGDA